MARPLYTICCESCSIDQDRNTISAFHILEGFDVAIGLSQEQLVSHPETASLAERHANPRLSVPSFNFVGISTWCRDEGESSEREYDFELLLFKPGDPIGLMVNAGKFSFLKRAHRFIANFVVEKPWNKTGTCRFEVRIRPCGSNSWMSQDYPFEVTVYKAPPESQAKHG